MLLARCFAAFNLYEEKKRKNNSHLDISTTVPQFQDPEHILTFPLHVLPSPHAEISQESLERRVLPRPCRWRRFRRKWGNFSMEISSIRRSIYIYICIYIYIFIYLYIFIYIYPRPSFGTEKGVPLYFCSFHFFLLVCSGQKKSARYFSVPRKV